MSEVNCQVIRDLLPLYVDNVCGAESRALVETHLAECADCAAELARLRAGVPARAEVSPGEERLVKSMRSIRRALRRKTLWVALIAVAMTAVLLSTIGLEWYNANFVQESVMTPASEMRHLQLTRMADGTILIDDDGFSFRGYGDRYAPNPDGVTAEVIITVWKPRYRLPWAAPADEEYTWLPNGRSLPTKTSYRIKDGVVNNITAEYYAAGSEDAEALSREITAIYVGSGEDRKLIWKKGDDIPLCEPWVEEFYAEPTESPDSAE